MNFDPYNCPLKIWESIETLTPKMGAHLGMWSSFSHTFHTPGSMKCDSWASFLACTFASPCLGCEPKARVMILLRMQLRLDLSLCEIYYKFLMKCFVVKLNAGLCEVECNYFRMWV